MRYLIVQHLLSFGDNDVLGLGESITTATRDLDMYLPSENKSKFHPNDGDVAMDLLYLSDSGAAKWLTNRSFRLTF